MNQHPYLSIGLPVYNGEDFIEQALDSILAQTFSDFELIISDNASTDRTAEICRAYAAHDARVSYFVHDHNRGAAPNFNFTYQQARPTKYYKWLAHDDICKPTYLECCINVLEADTTVVLAYPQTAEINASCEIVRMPDICYDCAHPDAYQRFKTWLLQYHRCFEFFGVIRKTELDTTGLLGNYSGADIVLLAELLLRGRFQEVPERLFLRRHHPGLFQGGDLPPGHLRTPWFDTRKANRIVFPAWRLLQGYVGAVTRSPLPLGSRVKAYGKVLWWMRLKWRPLLQDLRIAARQVRSTHSLKRKLQRYP
ncbi:MAG: glycosyltransferase family 2 protein [Chloroflexi bacterium]|nr:glycosyltransferase family 2 protein [Chloroflexota bacterium]